MDWKKEYLDLILVPSGFLIMVGYHLYLLYRYLKHTDTTVLGYEDHMKRIWIERMLQVEPKDRGQALTVIGSNMTAATSMSSTSLVLSSLIGAWVGSSSSQNIFKSGFVYGDTSSSVISIKYISLLTCFLLAFACFVHAARYFVQVNFFISMPNSEIPVEYVQKAMLRGGTFWAVGLRVLYFAISLLLWIFGPIPMFVSSVILVVIMHNLDKNSDPLHHFQPANEHSLLKKTGEEISAAARTIEHHERPKENGPGVHSSDDHLHDKRGQNQI